MSALPLTSGGITLSLGFLSIRYNALPISQSRGKACIWKCFTNYKVLCEHQLSQQIFTEGLPGARPLFAFVTIRKDTAPLQLSHWMSLSNAAWAVGSNQVPIHPVFSPLKHSLVTHLHQETLNNISAPRDLGHVSTHVGRKQGLLPPLLFQGP